MRLLILTGAGASRNLSILPDTPLPLMQDWSERFRDRIGTQLASMSTLDTATSGVEFERTLGALFAWELALDPVLRFAEMTRGHVSNPDAVPQRVREGIGNAQAHMRALATALHESLFEEFGPDRLNESGCETAFRTVLVRLTDEPDALPDQIVFATTNYDRSIEIALARMGVNHRTGFTPHAFKTPVLEPAGLGEYQDGRPSVIYLHGAVGWYVAEQTGDIVSRPADEPFNETLGRPAVLYPDPSKEIERTETALLWSEFRRALGQATHVLVIGHGLNDPYLLEALKEASGTARVGYVAHAGKGLTLSKEKQRRLETLLPQAVIIPGSFGPKPQFDEKAWDSWTAGATG